MASSSCSGTSSSGGRVTRALRVAHDRTVAVAHLEPPADLERDEGAAQGRAADAEVLGEAALGRQPVTGRETLSLDEVGDVVGQLLVEARTQQLAGPPAPAADLPLDIARDPSGQRCSPLVPSRHVSRSWAQSIDKMARWPRG